MIRRPRYDKGRRGLTLVELMVGLAVLGLLTVLGSSYLTLGTGTWLRLSGKAQTANAVGSTQALLRQVLGQAYPQPVKQNGAVTVAFDGQGDAVTFEGFLPSSVKTRTITRIKLALEQSPDSISKRLIMRWDDHNPGGGRSILLEDIGAAQFSYYDKANRRWSGTWTQQGTLPAAIGLDVAFTGENATRRAWPKLVVKPMLTASATCLYDPGVQACRE
jgi:prepilin-type N-terminal cleavage/methylation domain-containing protein